MYTTERRSFIKLAAYSGIVSGTVGTLPSSTRASDETADWNKLWEFETEESFSHGPTVIEGIEEDEDVGEYVTPTVSVFAGSDENLYSLNGATGEVRWHYPQGVESHLTVVDDTIYFVTKHGNDGVHAVDAKAGTLNWKYEPGEVGTHGPIGVLPPRGLTVADGMVFVPGGWDDSTTILIAVDADSGDEEWVLKVDGEVRDSPAVFDGVVFFTSSDQLHAVDAQTGSEYWVYNTGERAPLPPTVWDGIVYVVNSWNDEVVAIDAETGEKLWDFQVDQASNSPLIGPPTVAEEILLFADKDNSNIYYLDRKTGEEIESLGVGLPMSEQRVTSAPTVANGVVYTGTTDGLHRRALFPTSYDVDSFEMSYESETGVHGPIVAYGAVFFTTSSSVYAVAHNLDGPSEDSTVRLGTQNHHHTWDGRSTTVGALSMEMEPDERAYDSIESFQQSDEDDDEDETSALDEQQTADDNGVGFGTGSALAGLGATYYLLKRGSIPHRDDS